MDQVVMEGVASSSADHLFLLADSQVLIDQRDVVAAAACKIPRK